MKLCNGKPKTSGFSARQTAHEGRMIDSPAHADRDAEGQPFTMPFRRERLVCVECGRRIVASYRYQDGDIEYSLPPHKPKRWWKKKPSANE